MKPHTSILWGSPYAFLAASLLLIQGCTDSGPKLGEVHGRVTINGEPAPYMILTFVPSSGSRSSEGRTNAEGEYTLTFSTKSTGAVVGNHSVSIIRDQMAMNQPQVQTKEGGYSAQEARQMIQAQREASAKAKPIPAKFNANSELTANVEPGKNEINFDLQF